MSDIKTLTDLVIKFRNDRDWKQFHNAKDMAISLSLETGEFLEHFQWKSESEILQYIETHKLELSHELADAMIWILTISHDLKIDIKESVINKLLINNLKYPVSKSKGSHKKYTEFA